MKPMSISEIEAHLYAVRSLADRIEDTLVRQLVKDLTRTMLALAAHVKGVKYMID